MPDGSGGRPWGQTLQIIAKVLLPEACRDPNSIIITPSPGELLRHGRRHREVWGMWVIRYGYQR